MPLSSLVVLIMSPYLSDSYALQMRDINLEVEMLHIFQPFPAVFKCIDRETFAKVAKFANLTKVKCYQMVNIMEPFTAVKTSGAQPFI